MCDFFLIAGRRTIQDAFKKYEKPWDPYGIASFDLSELLLGQMILYLKAPIRNCPAPDVLGFEKKGMVGLVGAVDGPGSHLPFVHFENRETAYAGCVDLNISMAFYTNFFILTVNISILI